MKPLSASQTGYTLVELAISVAILSVLIVAGLLGVQSILTSGKVNSQIKTVAKLSAKASAMFANNSTGTTGITQQQVINVGGWDATKANGANITSSFGSSETITPNAAAIGAMAANTGFVYALHVAGNPSVAPADWAASVKAPGNANVSLAGLANSCNAANSDFYMALKP